MADYWEFRRTEAHESFRRARDLLQRYRIEYDRACASFVWPRPAEFNWALEWFDVIADGNDRPALELLRADGSSVVHTYEQLALESNRTANWLSANGVERGDRVLLCVHECVELWECLLACLKIGAVSIPTYPNITAPEVADRIDRGRVRHLICGGRTADRIGRQASGLCAAISPGAAGWTSYADREAFSDRFVPGHPTAAKDLAFGYFTSGTTSVPKLVAHTHVSYPVGHLSSMYWNGLLPGDRHANFAAPGWAKHSWSSLFVPWNAEATVVVMPEWRDSVEIVPRLLRDRSISSLCAPVGAWQALSGVADRARPALREATTAGEPLPEPLLETIRAAWGVEIREGYGQSETTAILGTTPGMVHRPGWVGKVLPGYRISVAGEESPARIGELAVEPGADGLAVGVMHGYLTGASDRIPDAVTGHRTGDVAEVGADGYVRILGRVDGVFKSFGHRVSPYEIEAVLRRHPGVAEAVVVASRGDDENVVPHAVVERHPQAYPVSPEDIAGHCRAYLPPELCPRSVSFVDTFPRTPSGKIRRGVVRVPAESR